MEGRGYLLESVHLSRELPGNPARLLLDDVNFDLAPGGILAVLGPSGAGKSSLLRLLNRLDEPTSGTVLLSGQDYREIPPRELRRRVGMIMQRAFLFPGTVAENIAFGPKQTGREISPSTIDELLSQVALDGYAARDAGTLSGGEAQRVAIVRALANDPDLLLLDEPTSALDDLSKSAVEKVFATLIERRGIGCIWVTHDSRQAKRLAGRALLLENGRVKALGRIEDVLQETAE
jgi:putative ABC transport system ATP-binding protein